MPAQHAETPHLITPHVNISDAVPGLRRLRFFMYSRRPDTSNFKTRTEEWKLLRSQWRFLHALYPYLGPPSYLYRRLFFPLLCPVLVALGCCLWDKLGTFSVNEGKTFLLVFRLTSFCMSLLLSVRLNRVYDRWWMARMAFSNIGNALVSLMRHACTGCDDPVALAEVQRWALLWQFSVLQCLKDERLPDPRAIAMMSAAELEAWRGTRKPRHLTATMMSLLLKDSPEGTFKMIKAMGDDVNAVSAAQAICVRIHFSALPYAITLHCTGFVFIWCLLLPFGLYPGGSWGAIFAVLIASMMLLGTDEVANQLENPYAHMPLEELMCGSLRDIPRVKEEAKLLRENEAAFQALLRARLAAAAPPPPLAAVLPEVAAGGDTGGDYKRTTSGPLLCQPH